MADIPDIREFEVLSPNPLAVELREDFATPESVVAAMYALLSGPAEEERERDWSRFAALTLPNARWVIAHAWDEDGNHQPGLREWDTEGFVADARRAYRSSGFWEREIWGRTEQFGNIAHRFSTYESRVDSEDSEPVSRGVNSIQLAWAEGRWWIANVVWHTESPDHPLPPGYQQPRDV